MMALLIEMKKKRTVMEGKRKSNTSENTMAKRNGLNY
jgi:hypothetical protein